MSSRSNAVAVERHSTAVYWFRHIEMLTTAVVALLLDSGWQSPDHQTHQARKHMILFPNKMWCTTTHLHRLSTQQNTTIRSLTTAHFLPVAILATILHCRLLWCTSYKQSSRTYFQNLVLSHFHSNINTKFCNTWRSDTPTTHWTLMTAVAVAKWWWHRCCIPTTLMSVIK
jgi:hypothetical protein